MDEKEALNVIKDVICGKICEYAVTDPNADTCAISSCRIRKALDVIEDMCMESITERMSDKLY